jgi:PmbA protein
MRLFMLGNGTSLSDLSEKMLSAAKRAGADHADVVATQGTSVAIEVRNGALEQVERSEGIDIGLRVFVGGKTATVSGSDVRDVLLDMMAERAVAMANEALNDPYVGLATADQFTRTWDIEALEISDPSPEPSAETLERDARMAEAAAQEVAGVSQVQSASAGYGTSEIFLRTSNGFEGGYSRTNRYSSCVAIAGEGSTMERDYDGDSRVFQSDLRSPEEIGRNAGERAVRRLSPRKPKTGTYSVIYDERISSGLIGHLLSAVSGAAVARGSSWLRDALGQVVLPEHLSLLEDPHRPRIGGSRPFDGEGLPTQRRKIIDNGVLTGWTLDLANGRKLNMPSTANAGRGVASGPMPTNWSVELTPGAQTRDDLIRDIGTGVLVTSLIGSTINPNTGDYSRGASGYWIENGELAYPINEITIAGNLRDMLRRIIPANDARRYLSNVIPSLLVEGMTIAGS